MVRPVDAAVAVHAAAVKIARVLGFDLRESVSGRRVEPDLVAALAEQGRLHDEHLVVMRAVRQVAGQTVLAHRRMLAQERAALVLVAGVAGLHHRVLRQQLVRSRAMRLVAGGAAHLALDDRHVGRFLDLRLLVGMALEAGLHLRGLEQQRPPAAVSLDVVHAVAGGAADALHVMGAPLPVHAVAALMAFLAGGGDIPPLLLQGIGDREEVRVVLVSGRARMQRTVAVAGLALVGERDALGVEQALGVDVRLEALLVGVAGKAALGADRLRGDVRSGGRGLRDTLLGGLLSRGSDYGSRYRQRREGGQAWKGQTCKSLIDWGHRRLSFCVAASLSDARRPCLDGGQPST